MDCGGITFLACYCSWHHPSVSIIVFVRSEAVLDFYRGDHDDKGRTLDDILSWPDEELEAVHDFIQWLFPLPERSGANPSAPVLDETVIQEFRRSPELQERLRQSFRRMMRFYGLVWHDNNVLRTEDFSKKAQNWLTPNNHNHLRITRILRSLHLLGLEKESQALLEALKQTYQDYPESISQRTFEFWVGAENGRADCTRINLPITKCRRSQLQ